MRLEVENIELTAGAFRLGPLSLEVSDGEYLVVLGPTGAGKTLTLEAVAGLRKLAAGRVVMDGRDVTRAAPEERQVGFLYQDSLLFPHLSVRDNLAYGAHRVARKDRAATIARLATILGIEGLLPRMPRNLSGGERQRVALGRALAANPKMLLLDEPMAALDPNSRNALRRTILELHRELGTTTIHVTHSFSEAIALGDRIAILMAGKVIQTGAPREVFAKPDSAQIARFLRSATPVTESSEPPASAPTILIRGLSIRMNQTGWRTNKAGDSTPEGAEIVATRAAVEITNPGAIDLVAGRVVAVHASNGEVRIRLNAGLEVAATIRADAELAATIVEGAGVWVSITGD